jgi:hypothetical protein
MEQILGSSSEDRLQTPVPAGRSLASLERELVDLSATIKGWGSDLAAERRPGVPRDAAPGLGRELLYPSIDPQLPQVKIHKSTEHERLTPIFGTACPPTGLSGMIRDRAYALSEGRLARWMLLMLADRVNVLEDLARDLATLRPPNLFAEMGLRTELRHNRTRFITQVVATLSLVLATLAVLRRGRRA